MLNEVLTLDLLLDNSLSPMSVIADCGRRTSTLASSLKQTRDSVTEAVWSLEQCASRTASARHRTGRISTATENVFFSCETPALSDSFFGRLRLLLLLLLLLLLHFLRYVIRK